MLTEGIPAALIEGAGKLAGMPVGPLSVADEVASNCSTRSRTRPARTSEPGTRRR